MMCGPTLTLDFFHDVVCGWCFIISPRLRRLAREMPLEIRHRTFVLQDSPARMRQVFGSPTRAKQQILEHWAACQATSDTPDRFNIEGMRKAAFDYPHGLPGALACKAAERLGGQDAHWRMFDAIQTAHLTRARNVADIAVLKQAAEDAGLGGERFLATMNDPATRDLVEADRALARRLQVTSVPTIIVRQTGARLINGPIEDLRAQMRANLTLSGVAG